MKSHAKSARSASMVIKRLLDLNHSLGVILPKEMARALGLRKTSNVKVYFVSPDMIVVTKTTGKVKVETLYGQN